MSTVTIHTGDSRQVLRTLPENSVDAIVTDPPYELGFMGKAWDRSGIANDVKFWDDCLRVLKPGGHLLAFSGSRTYHRMTCAIEDAGFEVRDQMMWVYGSGFPKSLNVGKKMEGWDGWGTALKPAHEPICVARKPLDGTVAENIRKWGVGGLNIQASRVDGKRWPANLMHDGSQEVLGLFPETKPSKSSKRGAPPHYNGQVMKDLCERGHNDNGGSAARFFYCPKASKLDRDEGCDSLNKKEGTVGDEGGAQHVKNVKLAKNFHPTVKPAELMRYLCRLVTPPGGTILDPFLGSGSTGKAAALEGFSFIGIDLSAEYAEIAKARIDHAVKNKC
jgi:site-specific DNA-methyltransferase (adenine-specific)